VKLIWLLAALLLTALTIGGIMTLARRFDPVDLILVALLGAGALVCCAPAADMTAPASTGDARRALRPV